MGDLRVELYDVHIGDVVGTDWRAFDFITSNDAFESFALGSTVLSESIPLVPVQNRGRASRRRSFFTELLPEGDLLDYLASQAKVERYNVVKLLSRYGRDVAGAIQIYDPEDPSEPRTPYVTRVNGAQIAQLLRNMRAYPRGNASTTGKTSLNGVQAKIVLVRKDARWYQAHDGFPSTHILKPQVGAYPTMIFDEEYGSRFARSLGLATHMTRIDAFDGLPTLVIERYDRSTVSPGGRIHQEDMNQVLGASGMQKYQNQGGKVSLRRMADVFLGRGDTESAERLAKINVMSVALGNLDLHAKNISVMHPFEGQMTLASAYDVVPQTHQNNDREMALAVNGKYLHSDITASDLAEESRSWGLADAEQIVVGTLQAIAGIVESETPLPGSHPHLRRDVIGFTTNLLGDRAAGDDGAA